MDSTFLHESEIIELTGYKLRTKQKVWLATHGWKFETDRYERPKVARSEFEAHMVSGSTPPKAGPGPNYSKAG